MKEETKTPKHWISIRVKPAEYTTIHNHFKATTCNKLSQYVRKVLLNKPVTINYRNQSTSEVLIVLNQLKKELSITSQNFNQVVHKLHTLDHISEIKTWLAANASFHHDLLKKVEEIRISMYQIYDQCARK